VTTRKLCDIVIGERHRRDLGDLDSLARSIVQVGGLLHPVVVRPDGLLIAGERRLRACQALGWSEVPVRVMDLSEAERILAEAAENLERKDFTPSEAVAAKRSIEPAIKVAAQARMQAGRPYGNLPQGPKGTTRDQVAALIPGYAARTLEKAEAIVDAAEAEPERFAPLLEEMDRTGKVDRVHKQLVIARARDAYEARREKGGTVADLAALAASGWRAGVIYADPPWPFMYWSARGGVQTSADNHFKTMTLAEIAAFGERYVTPLAAKDCALLLWATWPWIVRGKVSNIVRAWGFEPSTLGFLWVKQNPGGEGLFTGNGCWSRSNSEVCLLALRGSPMRLDMGVHEVVMAPVAEHSVKPQEVHDRIERLVAGPYLELFARKPRPGWMCWGDELAWTAPAADYDANDDFARSIDACYAAVRERKAKGGPGWPRQDAK
jgi:N6-adenosine-specific RNA methylase IME4